VQAFGVAKVALYAFVIWIELSYTPSSLPEKERVTGQGSRVALEYFFEVGKKVQTPPLVLFHL